MKFWKNLLSTGVSDFGGSSKHDSVTQQGPTDPLAPRSSSWRVDCTSRHSRHAHNRQHNNRSHTLAGGIVAGGSRTETAWNLQAPQYDTASFPFCCRICCHTVLVAAMHNSAPPHNVGYHVLDRLGGLSVFRSAQPAKPCTSVF